MVKRIVLLLFLLVLCACACFAALGDADDGYLTEGEYDYGVELFNHDVLIVEGGGADMIEMWDYSYLEVRYTSIPINGDWHTGGILDILIDDYSKLLYLDGMNDLLSIYDDAKATLKGGTVNHIRSYQYTGTKHIDLYCQPGWSWLYDSPSVIGGITGLWESGTAFTIDFIDKTYLGYDPVWMNINIIEIPEPATLLLITLGAALIRKR